MKKILSIGILLMTSVSFCAEAQSTLDNALQLLQKKNYVSAMDICNELLAATPDDPAALGVRSQIHTALGQYGQAMQDADKALSINVWSDRANYAKGEVLRYGQKDYNKALRYYDTAIKSNGQMVDAYSSKAIVYLEMQKPKDGMKVCDDALKKFPNEPDLYFVRGLLNYQLGRPKLSIGDYDKLLSLDADWNPFQVFLNRGRAHEALKKRELALQDYSKVILADPNSSGGYIARGTLLYGLAKYPEAADDFIKAEVLSPDNPVITYNIGMSYFKHNDKTSACRYFQKACAAGSQNACKMVIEKCSVRR